MLLQQDIIAIIALVIVVITVAGVYYFLTRRPKAQ